MADSDAHDDTALFAYTSVVDGYGLRLSARPMLLNSAHHDDALINHALPLPPCDAFDAARAARTLTPAEDRAVGALLGMAVGDAVGAPLEFLPYAPGGSPALTDGSPTALLECGFLNAFRLQPGQWTDDTSMGLCLADSLLAHVGTLEPLDLLLRFTAWWDGGYNNAFRFDKGRPNRSSVGLGGTIGAALSDFALTGHAATRTGDAQSSGNGVIMRLAAVPVCFHDDEARAVDAARVQARTTHAGEEATECAALMAALMTRAIHAPGDDTEARKAALFDALRVWETPVLSVRALARAEAEVHWGGAPDPDRDWRWRGPARLDFSPTRAAAMPGYIGSYAMDALSQALFCVASTRSFRDAILTAANLRGDADTVAAITGQIAGAIYGESGIPPEWIAAVEQWDGGGNIARRAHCLFERVGGGGEVGVRGWLATDGDEQCVTA